MEFRKQIEKKFHNKIRDEKLRRDIDRYKHLTSNKKFYSIARKSRGFINKFLIKECPGKKVLDYCCGNGETALFLAKKGAQAVGIDISATSIENAKKAAAAEGLKKEASFLVMDAENLKFDDNYFDLIVCRGVLHHLDVGKAYFELARVLKPGGKIICAEPLVYNPVFQLYRRKTPNLRTKWEMEHILSKKEINLAKKYFGKVQIRFFHLVSLAAVPFRHFPVFGFILSLLEIVDSILLKLPAIKWLAWQVVFILSDPKKIKTKLPPPKR